MDATRGSPSGCPPSTAECQGKTGFETPQEPSLPITPSHEQESSKSPSGDHSSATPKADANAPLPQKADTDAVELCDNPSYSLSASKTLHQVSDRITEPIPIRNSKPVLASNSFGQGEQYRPRHLSTPVQTCQFGSCRSKSSPDGAACSHGNQIEGSTDTAACGTGDMMGMGSWCPEAKEIKIARSLSGDSALFDMN